MKKLLIFFLLIVFHSLLFAQTDTIPAESVISKKVKISGVSKIIYFNKSDTITPLTAVVISYSPKCKGKINTIKYIKNGFATSVKHFTYYGNCNIREIFYTNNKYKKQGQYILFYPDKTKDLVGSYKNGKRDSLFIYYFQGKQVLYRYYKKGIQKLRTIPEYYHDTIKIKNILTVDIPTLVIEEFKLGYERMLKNKNSVFIELEYKPVYKTDRSSNEFNFSYNDYPCIGFLPGSKEIIIDYKYLFGNNLRKPFYFSPDLFYLTKSYNNVYCHYDELGGDGFGWENLQSFKCTKCGIMFNLGKKYIIGKSKNKINEIFDLYVGLGFNYENTTTTVFGNNYYSYWAASIPINMYNEPEVFNYKGLELAANFGIRFGFGFK